MSLAFTHLRLICMSNCYSHVCSLIHTDYDFFVPYWNEIYSKPMRCQGFLFRFSFFTGLQISLKLFRTLAEYLLNHLINFAFFFKTRPQSIERNQNRSSRLAKSDVTPCGEVTNWKIPFSASVRALGFNKTIFFWFRAMNMSYVVIESIIHTEGGKQSDISFRGSTKFQPLQLLFYWI